jgi:uncharacterized protein
MQRDIRALVGSGLSFPIRMNARGEVALVTGNTDIQQSIRIILATRPGERVMRPSFGCKAHELLFEPINSGTASLLQEFVHEALNMWEPRIQVLRVTISVGGENETVLFAEVEYQIKATHDIRSIVHPFYIEAEPEIV